MRVKTYLCPKSEAESEEIIAAFSAVSESTTPFDNDDGRCIIIVQDTAKTLAVAKTHNLQDVGVVF